MQHWKKVFLVLIIISIFLYFFFCFWETKVNYNPTPYEKKLIDYFKEVALKSEYDGNPEKVIKWESPMKLHIINSEDFSEQVLQIKKTINEINSLATDGFKIVLTDNYSNSNSLIYICKENKVSELNPQFYEILKDGIEYNISGLAYSEFDNRNYVIDMSLIFINSQETVEVQKSAIIEEITQSLGLSFDSDLYPDSVFYGRKHELDSTITEYSKLDKDVLRLLYHPKMKPGLDSIEVNRTIKRILKSEKN